MLPQTPLIRFGEWLPDRPAFENAGAVEAKNVRAVGEDYVPISELVAITSALGDVCRGTFSALGSDGVPYTFAGTETGMFLRNGSSWTDVSNTTPYTGTSANRWRFAQFGDYVFAVNGIDPMQYYQLGVSTEFADVTGAPVCSWIVVLNNFLIACGINGEPKKVQWSAFDDPLDWTASPATQADSQLVQDIGDITAITGGQNSGVVIASNGTALMEYVGVPLIFTFRTFEPNRGSRVQGSVVSYSNSVFYLGEDGFYLFNGAQSIPIGQNKVDQWFRQNANMSALYTMWASIDPRNKIVMWGVSGSSDNYTEKVLIYSFADNRFTWMEKKIEAMASLLTEAVNVDDVDEDVDGIEAFTDSTIYTGGRMLTTAFNDSHELCAFSGAYLPATIIGTEQQVNPNGRAYIYSLALYGDYTDAEMAIQYRSLQTQTPTTSPYIEPETTTGEANFGIDARFHRAVVRMTGQWDRIAGYKVRFRNTGFA